jgi:hypothetical protein
VEVLVMSKIVLVETVSMFRHIYAVELTDNDPPEYALDDVIDSLNQETKLEEFAQEHIEENIFSHRVITEEEYLQLFDQHHPYAAPLWTNEEKKKYIFKNKEAVE